MTNLATKNILSISYSFINILRKMRKIKSQLWADVKKIKFHHKVKDFYYKDLFRKIYTVAIIWLVAANVISVLKHQSFAQESEWNTATLINNSDWSKTLTYNGKSYTIAWSDLPWRYYWWWNEPSYDNDWNPIEWKSDFYSYSTNWEEHNNDWWWGNDVYLDENSPTGFGYWAWDDNREWRQWPCPEWRYVPSAMDIYGIMEWWCHLRSNDCSENDINIGVWEDASLGLRSV